MRKEISAATLALLVLILSIVNATADDYSLFHLTDPVSELSYTITQNGDEISVKLNSSQIGVTYIENACSFSLCGDVLSIFSNDDINGNVNCYFFDFYSDSIDSATITAYAYNNPLCFAADMNKNVYFVSQSDISQLNFYSNNRCNKIKLLSPVKELLSVSDVGILAICTDRVYYVENGGYKEISGLQLSTPVSYKGNGVIRDISGYEHNLREAQASVCTEFTTQAPEALDIPEIYFCEVGSTVSKIKKAFASLEVTRITKADGKDIDSGKLGTGSTVYFENNESMTVIINGELTGEGNINSRDVKAILNHLCRKELLSGSFLIAADTDGDGEVTTKDALKIAEMY